MLQMKNRLKYCSLAIAANRLVSGPPKNPVVFMDIAADGEFIGRIIIEASYDLLKLTPQLVVKFVVVYIGLITCTIVLL